MILEALRARKAVREQARALNRPLWPRDEGEATLLTADQEAGPISEATGDIQPDHCS